MRKSGLEMILDYMYLGVVGATYRMVEITQFEFMEQDERRVRRGSHRSQIKEF